MIQSSRLYKDTFSDEEVSQLFADEAHLVALLQVERSLANVQGELDIIPKDAAIEICTKLPKITVNPEELAKDCFDDGVVVPVLLNKVREELSAKAASYLHYGVTSQDIIDTALMTQLSAALEIFEERFDNLILSMIQVAEQHRNVIMAGRTRSQISTPITFGLKVANWIAPLVRQRSRLKQLRSNNIVLSLGGASGTLSVFSEQETIEVARKLSRELGLKLPTMPWHNQRDFTVEIAHFCALLCGSLAKMANDIFLMCQSGIEELSIDGGDSSTMPQKNNPVLAETIIALCKSVNSQVNGLSDGLINGQERDGAVLQLEWLMLPEVIVMTASSLKHVHTLMGSISVNHYKILENIDRTYGTILSEAAVFLLMKKMQRSEAQSLVKIACKEALKSKTHLYDILANSTDVSIDWIAEKKLENHIGQSNLFIDHLIKEATKKS